MSRFSAFGLAAFTVAALGLAACKPAEAVAPSGAPAATALATAPEATPAQPAFDEAAWAAMEERYLGKDKPTDPIEEFDWREVTCNFLGGEIGGDPEQDREVNARIEELRCGQQNAEARALKAAHPDDAALAARIDAYLARNPDPAV